MSSRGSSDISIDVAVGTISTVRTSSELTVPYYTSHLLPCLRICKPLKESNVQVMRNDIHLRALVIDYTQRGVTPGLS